MRPGELQAIRERCNNATEGPWNNMGDGAVDDCNGCVTDCIQDADAEFIAHAREDVPNLLEEVERLRGALKDACSDVHGWFGGTQEGYDITEKIMKALEGEKA